MRALGSKSKIKRVELRERMLIFAQDKPELAVWSELFGKYRGLMFKAASSPLVVYRLKSGEDPVSVALEILKDYYKILCEVSE